MRNKIIVLKMDGRKMEFEDSYWGWQIATVLLLKGLLLL